jgi:glutamine amidotransferase
VSTVAIVDYGLCNLDSVARAVEECGGKPRVTSDAKDLAHASHIILPGVGAFADAMDNLERTGLADAIREQVTSERIPFLGICLGMQLMATRGFEVRECAGLDLIPGEVRRFKPSTADVRIPHIGWNEVRFKDSCTLFAGIPVNSDFYFVHSFHLCCDDEYCIGRTPYADGFVSAVQRGRSFGTQFHPEKSQKLGFRLLRNFLSE